MQAINRNILRLAVPNIISNISIPLLGLIDLAVLGHLDSAVYIGAVALGGMIFNFIYWGFSFLRMGTSGFTAQAYGARNFRESSVILQRSLTIAAVGAVLILFLQIPVAKLAFVLIDGSTEVELFAKEYFYIRVWAAPATLGIYAFSGWFIGMQNTRFPMWITIILNLLNLGFNLFFVFVLDMNSNGVALGTVLAQYCGLLLSLFLFLRFYSRFRIKIPWHIIFKRADLKRFTLVNTDIIIRTLSLVVVFSFFTARSAAENDILLAVNTILLQFLLFFSYLIDGFAYAGEALTGKYYGAGNTPMMRKAIRWLFLWGLTISLPFSVVYLFGAGQIFQWLTSNKDVVSAAEPYLWWMALVPLISFPAFIWDGIYIGATASKAMRNSMLAAAFVFFLPIYFLLHEDLGNHALWLAMIGFMACRGIMLSLFAKKSLYNLPSLKH